MLPTNITNQTVDIADPMDTLTTFPLALVVQPDLKLYELLADLSPDRSWGVRKTAAQKLGDMRNSEALPSLLQAVLVDPFWMVRCAIIEALEKIGDTSAITVLQKVAESDSFQIVRSYAAKAIERLSPAG